MKLVQRIGTIPDSKQEVHVYEESEAKHEIERMIEKFAIRVVSVTHLQQHRVLVVYEEER